ncbi:hypothetical protein [Streptacidiphilus fuscans]|uniref:Uncharacterized protein n=1 Tax=Streptacidiphilus fuscans TaxID=2789292 RepID=A0A931B8C2_9ACTN|nr:hypothetical protein [Streptacidiphilus fuscans]MBF9071362.1 hypothetical protein [Streptacidiphilus fuscans]
MPAEPRPLLVALTSLDVRTWLDREGIQEDTPFLISPSGEYDVDLNGYVLSPGTVSLSVNTKLAIARDMKGFLNFLWHHRPPVAVPCALVAGA